MNHRFESDNRKAMTDDKMKKSRFGTFANELTQDVNTNEYGLTIWLGTKDEAEAEKLADEITELWNQNTDLMVKQ